MAFAVAGATAGTVRYAVVDLGPGTQASRINSAGEVAGTRSLEGGVFRAFLYAGGKIQDLGTLGGTNSRATGIGGNGRVVGQSQIPGNSDRGREYRPFVFSAGEMRLLEVAALEPERYLGEFSDVNESGVMAGKVDGRPGSLAIVANGRVTRISFPDEFSRADYMNWFEVKRINAAGHIVGVMGRSQFTSTGPHSATSTNETRHGFVYADGKITDLGEFWPVDINAAGAIVGSRLGEDGKPRLVIYDGREFRDLGRPPGFQTGSVSGLNAAGVVVGSGQTETGHGFLWSNMDSHAFTYEQGQLRDLNELVDLSGTAIKVLFQAQGINDRGQIICQGMGPKGPHAVLLTPVNLSTP